MARVGIYQQGLKSRGSRVVVDFVPGQTTIEQNKNGGVKMAYVDGFVLVVQKKNLQAYRRMSQKAGKVWREYGALEYRECAGDDLQVQMGIPFPRLLKLKKNETVVFSWIVYKSRSHRDSVNAKVMKDPRITKMAGPMPFDVKRMSYGGFKILVEA
jgi:uncharacterized protein YbaA (DUF1428 family)